MQREQQGRFLDVGVVAWSPFDGRKRRIWPEPLAAGHGRLEPKIVHDVGTIALHFVEAPEGIVGHRDPEEIIRHPAIVESIGPHAGHPALGHFHDFGFCEQPPFVHLDWVERVVVWSGTGGDIEVRLRFMQVMQNGGMPLQQGFGDILREFQILTHTVAIVVVRDVFAPIH